MTKEAMTRFDMDMDGSMEPSEHGQWVRYEDVQPKQEQGEPVAWMYEFYADRGHFGLDFEPQNSAYNTPLYTTPQPAQKPLTDEQFNHMPELFVIPPHHVEMVVRAIEAAHGIKEKNSG